MKRLSLWVTLIISLATVIGAYFYVTSAIQEKNNKVRKPRPEASEQALQITVMDVKTGSYTTSINASGLVEPRYSLSLTSQVSGEVTQISNLFEPGKVVKKGHLLTTLKNTELNSLVTSAENTLASAGLALKEEQRQGEQAKAEWKISGSNEAPDSDLVLREPHLVVAKAEYASAKAQLINAENNLQNTKIIAPFDALIIERAVSPGSYLSSGGNIGTLYSVDRAEINVDLSNSDWSKLPDATSLLSSNRPVLIESITNDSSWNGKVIHVGLHIDTSTRMRSLTIGLDKPLEQTPILIPGAFVNVTLQGKHYNNLWQLPNTALSQKSEIWYLDANNRLSTFETTPLFSDNQHIYIDVPNKLQNKPIQVVIQPYNSYLEGTLVSPIKQSVQSIKGNDL